MGTPLRGLIGRDRELDEADEALAAAASGVPQVLLVGGDAGIGKTTLVNAGAEEARARGFAVLIGHCLDIGGGIELTPVREALRQAVAGDTSGTELRAILDDLAAAGPVLLVLEDMHWADRSTIDFATAVAR